MDKNQIKEIRNNLIREHEEKNPGCMERKKVIFYFLAAMVATRLIQVVLNAAYCMIHEFPVRPLEYVMMFMMVLVAFLFSHLIYSGGIIHAAYFGLFGGVMSIYNAYNDGVFSVFASTTIDILYIATIIIFISTIIIQIATMLFICFDKKCKAYLTAMSAVQKELAAYLKSNQF